jgi:LysR family hydrogen peroxide-inducible transcriptional activator
MTIIQLEYLLAVVNYGSFSQAAERRFVTQPSLSMQIKSLEEELGVVLLDRTKKPVMVTQVGQIIVEKAREALKIVHSIYEDVELFKGKVAGQLRLGIIPTIAPYLLPDMVREFGRRCPDVDLEIKEMITRDIIRSMEHDQIDAAVVTGGSCPDGIMEEELFDDRFYAYVSPEHPLHARSNVRVEDMDLGQILLLSDGHCLRQHVLELCSGGKNAGRKPACYFESGSLETLIKVVDCTDFLTIIPEMVIPHISAERRSQVKPIARGAVSRKVVVAVRRTYVKDILIRELKGAIMDIARGGFGSRVMPEAYVD